MPRSFVMPITLILFAPSNFGGGGGGLAGAVKGRLAGAVEGRLFTETPSSVRGSADIDEVSGGCNSSTSLKTWKRSLCSSTYMSISGASVNDRHFDCLCPLEIIDLLFFLAVTCSLRLV